MEKFSNSTKNTLVIMAVLGAFFLGIYVDNHNRPEIEKVFGLSNKQTQVTTEADFSPFWKVWNTINEKYPKADKITDQDRVYGAISGLMGSLNDPYSVFFNPDEAKVFEDEINNEQLGTLPYQDLKIFVDEYSERKSKESLLAKDADLIDQILLLREYEWSGNNEAHIWLYGKGKSKVNAQLSKLKTETGKKYGEAIYKVNPSDWWNNLYTSINRK